MRKLEALITLAALTPGVQILRLVMDTAGSGTEYVGNFNWIRVAPQ